MNVSPTCISWSAAGDNSKTMVCPAEVCTFARRCGRSRAVTVPVTFPWASLPWMSAADCEGTRTVTGFPPRSMDWYVVPAPSMETILALAWARTVLLVPTSVLYLWRASAAPDHPWVTRRFLPTAFPALILLALPGFAAKAARRAAGRPTPRYA